MADEGVGEKIFTCVVLALIVLGFCFFKFGVWFAAALLVLILWMAILACWEEGSIAKGIAKGAGGGLVCFIVVKHIIRIKDPIIFGKLMFCFSIVLIIATIIIFLCKKKKAKSEKK